MDINQYISFFNSRYPVLSSEDNLNLIKKANSGCKKSFDLSVNHNMGLVFKLVLAHNLDNEKALEACQEGSIGLIRAIEKFNPLCNTAFSTYATYWVRFKVEAYLNSTHTIAYVPTHTMKLAWKVNKTIREIENNGQNWSFEALAKELYVSEKKVRAANNLMIKNVSSDNLVDGSDLAFAYNEATSSKENIPLEEIYTSELNKKLNSAIESLPEKLAFIVVNAFGLNNTQEKNFTEISIELGISRQYAAQASKTALNKISKQINGQAMLA